VKAVIVGTGRVACGFVGPALRAAGHALVFVGRNPLVVEHLGRVGRYDVRLIEGREIEELVVDGVRTVHTSDADAVAREIAAADVVATAVGAENLSAAASVIAPGLLRRTRPVNVLAFENVVDAGTRLRSAVTARLNGDGAAPRHGFAGALVCRVIAQRLGDPLGNQPLTFVADPPCTFRVEAGGLAAPLPAIPGMALVDDYDAWMRSKLYIFGAGHATAGYLGYLKGYRFVHSAVRDREVRAATLGAMAEGQEGVRARYGADKAGGPDDLPANLARFENAALCDPVYRVGRDPCRKLGCYDRLVGAARLAEEAGETPQNLALSIAAALYFQSASDPSAAELRFRLRRLGVEATLESVCGLHRSEALLERVTEAWAKLIRARDPENFLLDLGRCAWAAERRGAAAVPAPAAWRRLPTAAGGTG
jgi:mannitol-1-phosphate 5-dehydrogenase